MARVVKIMADRRIQLLVADARIVARVETAVREGETLLVEVDRLIPEVVLRVRRTRQEVPG